MNTIYKVIWSKAKNCYVVASEIARSHTKSATGSEKMGRYGKRALLALAAATAIVCGGFVNVGAADIVHVDESGTTQEVYTKAAVDTALDKKADKDTVEDIKTAVGGPGSGLVQKTADNATGIETNKTAISALKETVGDDTKGLTKKINDNAEAITNLKTNVNAKADATTVNGISTRVGTLETTVGNDASGLVKDVAEAKNDITTIKNTIDDKANKSDVYDKNTIDTKLGDYTTTTDLTTKLNQKADANNVYSKTDAENKFADKTATENALADKANQSDLNAATGRITTAEDKITKLETKTGNLSTDGKSLTDMDTVSGTNVSGTTVSGDTVKAGSLNVTDAITDGVNATTLSDIKNSMTQTETNKIDIGSLKTTTGEQDTAIKDLQKKTTKISYADGAGTSIDGITVKDGNIVGNGNSAITGITNIATDNINGKSLAGTTVATEKDVTDAVGAEKTDRVNADEALSNRIGSLAEDKNYIKKDKNVSDNLIELDKQAKTNADAIAQEKTDRENAIGSLTEDKNYIKKDKNVSDNLVELDKQAKTSADAIAQEKTDRENAIGSLTEDKNYIKKDKNVSDNLVELDKQAKTNADAIAQEKTDRENAIGSLTEDKNYIKKDKNVSDNLVELDKQAKTSADAIAQEKTDRENAIGSLTEDKNYIKKDKNVSDNLVELDKQAKTNADAIAQEKTDRENAIGSLTEDKNYIKKDKNVSDNLVELDKQAKTNADDITETNQRTAGITRDDTRDETSIEGKVTVDTNGNIKAEGTITSKGLDAGDGEIKTTGKVSTGTLETTGDANIGGNLDVNGTLKTKDVTAETIHVSKTEDTTDYESKGSIIGEGGNLSVSNKKRDKITNITKESELNVNEEGTVNWATSTDNATGNVTEGRSEVTADNIKNSVKKTEGGTTFGYEENITTDGKVGTATDKDGNKSTTKQESDSISSTVYDKDGNVKASSEMKEDGSISNNATGDMTNTVGGNLKNEVTGDIENSATNITNTTTGDMTNTIGGKLTTTVTGAAEENYNGGLTTNVTGEENHTVTGNQNNKVTGKQTNTVEGGQENIISGGQTNTITGGQINNITGDQTTTITGNKKETVTENVTEDYKKDLTTTVGGNEIHDVKGTKTETVEGKVTENFKGGQETNVTGDQTTNVSGTQTTNATDINRNASSAMIDTVDNAYGTNKETKEAGKTTTEVSIKGTGESGTYIRGATESRDYIIKGTLSNSETKTAEMTSTEITDGNGKTSSTIQDVTQISGSVTDGTNMAVSNVKADSIDSTVAGGTDISTINQRKDSIISQVSDGTTATKTEQTAKDITNMAQGGTITNNAKDIVNRATGAIENSAKNITNTATDKITDQVGSNTRVTDTTSITDTVGTASRKTEDGKITDTAGDSTVITENGEGTTFKKTGSTAYGEGGPTDTNISGNLIQTGRIESNELNVSDKDGDDTADLNVKAGEGVTASASDGNTKGSLDVKANEVGSSVKDAAGNGSDFRQRIDAIVGKVSDGTTETKTEQGVKDITNTATGGTIKNDAKDIENKASNSMTETVGGTNVTKKTAKSTKSTIENSDVTTAIEQTDEQIQTSVIKKDGSASNVSTDYANASANRVTEDGQTSTVINNKNGLLIQNSDNQTSFTTENGTSTGAAQGWTNIKGNEISTGKVEANYVKMGYADVMKDLGVRGNANIAGKTTTGELEVTGTSTLRGDVTMEGNATVKKDLTVEGTTTTKDLQVTNNATIGGTLDVAGKSNFHDDVIMDKNLTVGGNVDAGSFTVKGTDIKIDQDGINAGGLPITNVGDGSVAPGSKDVVNGGQLYNVKTDLEGKVNKVGANAAAMANLHPMEFDPDSKWNIAAAMGNYGSETATAMGLFYRPNEDVMVNLSTAFGTGENMVGGGVSVRLGQGGNKLTRKENNELKAQVNDLTARMDALLSVLNPNMSKDFPDVPENHWAYEAVSRLAGNDIVQGYPDGEFHGERTMTRYEMAEIIYKALSRGAEAEKKLVDEFKPELQAMAASNKATAEAPVSEAE